MADLDAELLALAGGDSSGEESYSSPPKKKSSSPDLPSKQSHSSALTDMARKGTVKAVRKIRRRRDDSDNEKHGSASSSPRSDSASMSESSAEAEYAPTEDKPIFAYDSLYHDAKDKSDILAKPEIEREEILAQRSEQVERHEQDLKLRRMVAARAKEEAKAQSKNKRKAGAADLEESQRKSSRQRTKLGGGKVGEVSSAIEAYKQQRAEKSLRDEQRRRDTAARRAASPENRHSDSDAQADSDHSYYNDRDRDRRHRSPTPPKDDPVAELADIQRAKVGRDNFAQVAYYPGFEEALTDCYARVCLGPGRTPGVNEYRMCLIKGFTKGRPYAMTSSTGRLFPVDSYILAAHGKATKSWSFLECSMSKFTDDEWRRYKITMANEELQIPTKGRVSQKLDDINKLLNHRFTEAEITEKLKKQNDLTDIINRTKEKQALQEKLSEAHRAGDEELVMQLQDEIAAIVPMKLGFNTSLQRPESNYVNKEQEKLAELNRRNQRLNAENVRKAQIAEIKSRRKRLVVPGHDDLFDGGSDISRSGTPGPGSQKAQGTSTNGANTPAANGTPRLAPVATGTSTGTPRGGTPIPTVMLDGNNSNSKKRSGLPVIRRTPYDDDILRTMDLGIDIDIEL